MTTTSSLRTAADLLDAHADRDRLRLVLAELKRRDLADLAELLTHRLADALTAGFYAEAEGAPDRVADVYAAARMRQETNVLRRAAELPGQGEQDRR